MNAPQQQIFGLLLPGRQVRTDFVSVDDLGTKFTILIQGENPLTISDIVFFLLPGVFLPSGTGAVLYWMVEGTAGFETLGAIVPERPSGVFSTGFASNDTILNAVNNNPGIPISITIAISIEPLANIANMGLITRGVEDRILTAKNIALDLYNYLKSFDFNVLPDGAVAVPANIFDRWIKRFEMRCSRDPNFFLRTQS